MVHVWHREVVAPGPRHACPVEVTPCSHRKRKRS